MITTLLFDLDGTLVDLVDFHYLAFNTALKKITGFEISKEEEEKFNGLPTLKKLELLATEGRLNPDAIPIINAEKQRLTLETIGDFVKPDLEKEYLLRRLTLSNFKLGCVTNSVRQTALLVLEKACLLRYFNIVISNEDVKNSKPDPEGYQEAMRIIGVSPRETLVFEDAEKGVLAAMRSGAWVFPVKNSNMLSYRLVRNIISVFDSLKF